MDIQSAITKERLFFAEHKTQTYDFRIAALKKLATTIRLYEPQITQALWNDLRKAEAESYATEIGLVLKEIAGAVAKLRRWMRPKHYHTPLMLMGSKSKTIYQPYGVVLIIAPWNYPFQLLFSPLIGAIAAGNCAMVKPSPTAAHTSEVIKTIIQAAFDSVHVAMADISTEKMEELLAEKFDYIFYTGGASYGKHVMQCAAKNLTPITLELGGKSPCIVDSDANLEMAARRIVWGKFINAGQTCVAPDYLLVHEGIKKELLRLLAKEINRQWGAEPKLSSDYPRIISRTHCQRLAKLLSNGNIAIGGQVDLEQNYIAPTVLTEVDMKSELMEQEIFGPIMPIVEFSEIDSAIDFINERPHPLAIYCFTKNRATSGLVVANTRSGGVCINDVVVQVANTNLPFGGVGDSGIGNYHGLNSFLTFSHQRAVVRTTTLFNLGVKFAPYKSKINILKKFM
ncbi:MAG: aldehyde dehydrogenase [Mucinivorans sp.]